MSRVLVIISTIKQVRLKHYKLGEKHIAPFFLIKSTCERKINNRNSCNGFKKLKTFIFKAMSNLTGSYLVDSPFYFIYVYYLYYYYYNFFDIILETNVGKVGIGLVGYGLKADCRIFLYLKVITLLNNFHFTLTRISYYSIIGKSIIIQ